MLLALYGIPPELSGSDSRLPFGASGRQLGVAVASRASGARLPAARQSARLAIRSR